LPLVLIDEFEGGFEEDPNFLASLRAVIKTSRAPVIFICDDELPNQLSSNGRTMDAKNFPARPVRFFRPSLDEAAKKLQLALKIDKEDSLRIAKQYKSDLRACLNAAHFGLSTKLGGNKTTDMPFEIDGLMLSNLTYPVVTQVIPVRLKQLDEEFTVNGENLIQGRICVNNMPCERIVHQSDSSVKAQFLETTDAPPVLSKTVKKMKVVTEEEDELSGFEKSNDEITSEDDNDFEPVKPKPPAKKGRPAPKRVICAEFPRFDIIVELVHAVSANNKQILVSTKSTDDLQNR
jgi:hypothetical protein